MLTRIKGNRTFWVGKIDGTLLPLGVEKYRYKEPVTAAKADWMVLRTIEKVNRSVELGSASETGYEVVVIASCRTPHNRLH
jgi:hypothetical protein